jgi:hypothetical protein
MRKILISRSYIKLKSGNLEFFVSRRYFGMLKAAMEEAERMRNGELKEITL